MVENKNVFDYAKQIEKEYPTRKHNVYIKMLPKVKINLGENKEKNLLKEDEVRK